MRDKCSYLLTNHGMVILDWKKIDGIWKPTEKVLTQEFICPCTPTNSMQPYTLM